MKNFYLGHRFTFCVLDIQMSNTLCITFPKSGKDQPFEPPRICSSTQKREGLRKLLAIALIIFSKYVVIR